MLLVEQNAAMALEVADHGYVMETGRIVLEGSVGRAARQLRHPRVLSRAQRGRLAQILSRRQALQAPQALAVLSGSAAGIAAIVLAAGRSTRMGATNKLLADVGGKPMMRHAVEAALASQARPILVVTGHMAAEVSAASRRPRCDAGADPTYATGLASSLKAAIVALPARAKAPYLTRRHAAHQPGHLDTLIAAHSPDTIVVPVHGGSQGNPVLWPAQYFPELLQLDGDAGARAIDHCSQLQCARA